MKNKRYFFWQIFIIIILLLIVSGLTSYIVYDKVKEKNIEDKSTEKINKEDKSTEEINKETFDFSKVIDAINNNLNLSEQEKNKILANRTIFEDNFDYYDINVLTKTLKTLKIKYVHDICVSNKIIKGTYDNNDNLITFYTASSLDDVTDDLFTHEFSHLFQSLTLDSSDCSFLVEATNVLANNEYYGTEPNYDPAYSVQRNCVEMLSLIIGNSAIKKFYNLPSIHIIVDELYKIYPNYEKAYEFVGLLNSYQSLFFISDKDENVSKKMEEIEKLIKEMLQFYYKEKYKFSAENDLIMLFKLDSNKFNMKVKEMLNLDNELVNAILKSNSSIINTTLNNKYVFDIEKTNIIDYEDVPIDHAIDLGAVSKSGEILINGWSINSDGKTAKRPIMTKEKIKEIVIDDSNRYLE